MINFVFRVDSSIQIGTGHVMRCLTLADELARQGHKCLFICQEQEGHLGDLITRQGYEVSLLANSRWSEFHSSKSSDNAHADWLGVSWQQDAEQTLQVLSSFKADWLVIDHYTLDCRYERQLRPHVGRIMVIDDLADRAHDCDLLLDQNLGRDEADYQNLVPNHCSLLIGPQYALLRPEFNRLRDYSLKRRENTKFHKLLITMGGVDKDNATGLVLASLKGCHLPVDCQIDVVMGASAPWLGYVQEMATQIPWPTEVSVNVDDMAQRMVDADLAIGAGGSTSWERCCLGLPTVLVVLAYNQVNGAKAQEAVDAAITITDLSSVQEVLPSVLEKVRKYETLQRMSHAAATVTDGKGVSKLVLAMMSISGDCNGKA